MEKLKSCPFCGGKTVLRVTSNKSSHNSVGFNFEIMCDNCKVKLPKSYNVDFSLNGDGSLIFFDDEREQAIKDWNNRT